MFHIFFQVNPSHFTHHKRDGSKENIIFESKHHQVWRKNEEMMRKIITKKITSIIWLLAIFCYCISRLPSLFISISRKNFHLIGKRLKCYSQPIIFPLRYTIFMILFSSMNDFFFPFTLSFIRGIHGYTIAMQLWMKSDV